MATEEGRNIDDLVSSICKDFLERRNFKDKCLEFLTHVSVPNGWENIGYRLHQGNPTYKYRKKLLKNFIDKQKSQGFSVTNTTTKQFFEQLQHFSDLAETKDSFSEFCQSGSPGLVDLFEKNVKLCGVVIRKCKYDASYKASVLIKRDNSKQDGRPSLTEHVVDFQNESDGGYNLKVGDIVEVTQCRRKKGVAMEPEVIK